MWLEFPSHEIDPRLGAVISSDCSLARRSFLHIFAETGSHHLVPELLPWHSSLGSCLQTLFTSRLIWLISTKPRLPPVKDIQSGCQDSSFSTRAPLNIVTALWSLHLPVLAPVPSPSKEKPHFHSLPSWTSILQALQPYLHLEAFLPNTPYCPVIKASPFLTFYSLPMLCLSPIHFMFKGFFTLVCNIFLIMKWVLWYELTTSGSGSVFHKTQCFQVLLSNHIEACHVLFLSLLSRTFCKMNV